MIRSKNIIHKSHYILGNETMKQEYKKYSNKLTKIKLTAKTKYYAKELEANTGNPRITWEVLRTLLPVNSTKSSALPSAIDLNGRKVTDQQIMLCEFNNFFFSKLFGIAIDEKLNFAEHITKLACKISRSESTVSCLNCGTFYLLLLLENCIIL